MGNILPVHRQQWLELRLMISRALTCLKDTFLVKPPAIRSTNLLLPEQDSQKILERG